MTDKIKLENMLWRLCRIQDEITHLNESGAVAGLRELKGKRRDMMDKILKEAEK